MLVVFWTCLDSGFLGFGYLAPGFWVSVGLGQCGFLSGFGFSFWFWGAGLVVFGLLRPSFL